MVAAGHRGHGSGAVSTDIPLSNHATQRTPCARRLKKGKNAVGGAHGAADGSVGRTTKDQEAARSTAAKTAVGVKSTLV